MSYDYREMYLTEDKSGICQTEALGNAWTSLSKPACFAACMSDYPDTCRSMVYNEVKQTCIPGGTSFAKIDRIQTSIPKPNSSDTLFYAKMTVPACNTSNGFALYELCGTTVCLYLSTYATKFAAAVQKCRDMNSTLFIANTLARFSLFWDVSLNNLNQNTFLWLTDNITEGQFVWGNGEPLSETLNNYIWAPRQPNGFPNENCVQATHAYTPNFFGVHDYPCTYQSYFICERNM
ncbi:C-type lectin domain family 4 member e-like [Plakobranchus ocellatus]|uniref:C-type lectin domain family 4 member e-like n=1 Tax=Plakobranchus ocellatus TaxID=259542 RepID=A0AAV4A212_9GAST|nr:C-type lectin domain family 4 member e-like [Plakobranchus ocellatus]